MGLLRPYIEKRDTCYRLAIPAVVRIAVMLFKLAQGSTLLLCSELFAVGRSTISEIMKEVVMAINVVLRNEIKWLRGVKAIQTQNAFKEVCGLPDVLGAIDCTHISISKPKVGSEDYYHFKSGGYTFNCQAVVDSNKKFLDLYLGMPGSTHDERVLRRSSLYHLAQNNNLFDPRAGIDGFPLSTRR
jgi:hypothetical protein